MRSVLFSPMIAVLWVVVFIGVGTFDVAEAQNILTNPGFETGDTSGWAAGGSATIAASTAQVRSDTYSCFVSNRDSADDNLVQDLIGKVGSGQAIEVSAWVRLATPTSVGMQLGIRQNDGLGGTDIGLGRAELLYDDQWVELTATAAITVTGTLTQLDFYFGCMDDTSEYYVDDVSMTIIEDPYRLTVNVTGSGSVQFDPNMGPSSDRYFPAGTLVRLTAIPDSGSTFNRWEGDLTGWAVRKWFSLDEDMTVTAVFGEYETVTGSDFYVSSGGDDSNPGTYAAPFASVKRARDAVRGLVNQGLTEDVTVWIRGGTYYLEDSLDILAEDSGTAEYAITYRAYPGENAELVGGVPVTGWTQHSGNIYKAPVPEGAEIAYGGELEQRIHDLSLAAEFNPRICSHLFEDGERMQVAQTPNQGWLIAEDGWRDGPWDEPGSGTVVWAAGDLDSSGWDISEAYVSIIEETFLNTQTNGFELPITSIEVGLRAIHIDDLPANPETEMIRDGCWFKVKNVMAELDQAGECFISAAEGMVYAWPRGGAEGLDDIVMSAADHIIRIEGDHTNGDASTPSTIVQNVHFQDLNLSIAHYTTFYMEDAEDCSVRSCLIENGSMTGIQLQWHVQDCEFVGNHIRHQGSNGINANQIGDPLDWESGEVHDITVDNNYIHHCGEIMVAGGGIVLNNLLNVEVNHNYVHDVPRHGIGMAGAFNNVTYNHVHDTCLLTDDGPGISMGGEEDHREVLIDHNVIHDVGPKEPTDELHSVAGIYIDGDPSACTVTNNVVYNVKGTRPQALNLNGTDHVVENNIFVCYDNGEAGGDLGTAVSSNQITGPARNATFQRNIVYYDGADGLLHSFWNSWHDDRYGVCDYNIYWKPVGVLENFGSVPGGNSYGNWISILGGKFDQNTLLADPLFVDPEYSDFHLQNEVKAVSPAFALGFEDIDTSEIGLVEGWMEGRDTDGDGIEDYYEVVDLYPETCEVDNPFDPDDDDSCGDAGDTEPDGIPDGQNDWDGDGMSNAEEIAWGYDMDDPLSFTTVPALSWLGGIALGLLLMAFAAWRVWPKRLVG